MSGNPYDAPASPIPANDAGDDYQRITSAKRWGRHALGLFALGLMAGWGCGLMISLRGDDPAHADDGPNLFLLGFGLLGCLGMFAGMVIGMIAVARGALRRRPVAPSTVDPPSGGW